MYSCSDRDIISENEPDNRDENDSQIIITPTVEWGMSLSDVKSIQDSRLSLTLATEKSLRYKVDGISIDYSFEDGGLSGTVLMQANISSIDDMVKYWLEKYNQLAISENTVLYVSENNSTLAYGKILKGNDCDYASIAWTYIDENEETNEGPDFSPSGTENGYDYVDLGVGIGWAVQNVGASSPEKAGGYYMWGETTTRTNCWWWYYSLYRGDVNDYLDTDKFYTPYSDISGTSYDAATAKMGGRWRMPTRAEFYTLINNCKLEVGEYNGISGFVITGLSGKSVFLPAAGYKKKEEIKLTSTVYLWSSTTCGKLGAYLMEYKTKNLSNSSITFMEKYYGLPIRGVVDLE